MKQHRHPTMAGAFDIAWNLLKSVMAERPMQPMPAMGYFDRGRENAHLFNQANIATQQQLLRDNPQAYEEAAYNQNNDRRNLHPPSKDPRISVPMSLNTVVPSVGPARDYSQQAANLEFDELFPGTPPTPVPAGMGQLTHQDLANYPNYMME